LEGSTVRVLVVDDHEPFRRFVCATLAVLPFTQVIGEASDGFNAIRKAEELQPDLVVLDIGLPALNGIEAGRRIRKLCPDCKILFLSQESSVEVAEETFKLGASAYLVKAHAGSELSAAVKAVCQGRRFVSKRFRGLLSHNRADATYTQAPRHFFPQEVFPPLRPGTPEITHRHRVNFYSHDAAFILGLASFVEAALNEGNPVIVVATESHRKCLFQTLLARGIDGAAEMQQGLYTSLDVYETLSTFMVHDLPDSAQFLSVFHDLLSSTLKAAKARHPRVSACGEFAPTLLAQGKVAAAIRVEHLTDEVARAREVDILCGYVLTRFQREQESHIYERICAEHSAVLS
jgi:DNA-binding NarL/FixJ family response regulator